MVEEMSFEEQFPELIEINRLSLAEGSGIIPEEDLQKYCLSKQRVKDLIEDVQLNNACLSSTEVTDLLIKLKKELGL